VCLQADKGRAKDAGKAKAWASSSAAVSSLFKPGAQPDTFSLEGGALTLHEPPTVLRATEPDTDEQLLQVKVTRILLRSYFSIVRASLVDTVPKAVMHFLVNAVQRGLQQHLIRTLYRDEVFGDLLREQPELAQHRMQLSERLTALNEAVHALHEVPEELRLSG
jgi:dynamin 1-like protein